MKVNLNHVRARAIDELNVIIEKLNEAEKEEDGFHPSDIFGLQEDFEDLRVSLVTLAYSYDGDNPDFQVAVSEDKEILFPEWENE